MWKEWLNFSRGERYGLIVLFLLICAAAVFPYVYSAFVFQVSTLANPSDFHRIDSFFSSLRYEPQPSKSYFSFQEEEKPVSAEPELFRFDPNTVSTSELVRLGFTKRQAGVIENYRTRGGVFKAADDFAKIFVVDDEMFQRLKPFIEIAPQPDPVSEARETDAKTYHAPQSIRVELNSTDTIELVKLRGIGRGYARRIVSYRQMLGGYVNVDQLKEVYGFPEDLLESLRPQLWVDSTAVNRINLNLVEYQDLRKHPYLSEYQARAVIYYRETIGNFNSVDELLKNKLLDENTFKRVNAYLTVR